MDWTMAPRLFGCKQPAANCSKINVRLNCIAFHLRRIADIVPNECDYFLISNF